MWFDGIVLFHHFLLSRLTFCLGIRYTNIYFHFINVDKSKSESGAEKKAGQGCSWNVFGWISFWTAKLISPYDWILSPSINRDCHHRHLSRARSTKTNIFKRAHPSKVNKNFLFTKLSANKFFLLRIFPALSLEMSWEKHPWVGRDVNLQSPNEMNFKRFLESEEASRNLEMVYVKVLLCFCCLMTNDSVLKSLPFNFFSIVQ